jgi:hypothetical protein
MKKMGKIKEFVFERFEDYWGPKPVEIMQLLKRLLNVHRK